MTSLYIASSFRNIPEVRAVMDLVRGAGHTVTWDWTRENLDPSWTPEQQDAYLQNCGADDFNGVIAADALVLVNHTDSRDAMTEFGIALGRDMSVFVLYPKRRTSVFFHRAAALCDSIPELLAAL